MVKKINAPVLTAPNIQAAHAILFLGDNQILQLRETKPGIAAQGQWSPFGGRKKADETPLAAISREIYEEPAIQPKEFFSLHPVIGYNFFDL